MATLLKRVKNIRPGRFRVSEALIGTQDNVNQDFTTNENFIIDLGDGGKFLNVFRNGQLQVEGVNYTIIGTGNVGTGIHFIRPPVTNDCLLISYVTT